MTDFCRYTLTRPHAFVVMPFGTKAGVDGKLINFNLIYEQYIAPALMNAGLEVFELITNWRLETFLRTCFKSF